MEKFAVPETNRDSARLRPTTRILTQGFDPTLSVGSARPAVFRSSTYVFPSPEAAEHAFDVASGRAQALEGESTDLIYSRFNHPNAQMLEDQIVNLEERLRSRAGLQFRHGCDRDIAFRSSAARPIRRLHDPDLRRHAAFHSGLSLEVGRIRHSRAVGAQLT